MVDVDVRAGREMDVVDVPVCMLRKLPQMKTALLSSRPVMG